MESDIPIPDFSLIDFASAPFETQLTIPDSGIPFPDIPSVVANFGFSLLQDSPIRCTSNSSVYVAVDRGNNICVLKVSRNHTRLLTEFQNRLFLGECNFLVDSYDVFQTDDYSILQMELCHGGDLHAQRLSEVECWQLLATIGRALAHIHENDFLHLDVSPSNIFRSEVGFKLGDFGTLKVAGQFKPGDEGAGAYAAPEVFTESESESELELELESETESEWESEKVWWAADVFALGVCVMEAASGYFAPRGGELRYGALRRGEIGLGGEGYLSDVSGELKQFVNAMMNPNPNERPPAELIARTAEWALENLKF